MLNDDSIALTCVVTMVVSFDVASAMSLPRSM